MEISEISINQKSTLIQALKVLDKSGLGTICVVDNDSVLTGVLTDGDIRRFLLSRGNLETKIVEVMNKSFTSLPVESDNEKILESINNEIKIIPLINEEGHLIDYASVNRLRRISISEPLLNGNELLYVTDCIKTNWVSSQGKYVRLFEKNFKDYHYGFEALAVSNGTVALHLAMEALGIGK